MFLKETPDEVKKEYVKRYIIKFWDVPLKDSRLIFGRDFKVDGKYSVKSFDLFFNNIVERINKYFFDMCPKIIERVDDAIRESYNDYLCSHSMSLTSGSQASHKIMKDAQNYRRMMFESYKLKDIDEYRESVVWAFI